MTVIKEYLYQDVCWVRIADDQYQDKDQAYLAQVDEEISRVLERSQARQLAGWWRQRQEKAAAGEPAKRPEFRPGRGWPENRPRGRGQ